MICLEFLRGDYIRNKYDEARSLALVENLGLSCICSDHCG